MTFSSLSLFLPPLSPASILPASLMEVSPMMMVMTTYVNVKMPVAYILHDIFLHDNYAGRHCLI
jgi:hypothetical protein